MTHELLSILITLQILPVGALLMLLPKISRRGLLFGVYVGEEASQGVRARRIARGWYLGMTVCLAASLAASLGIGWLVRSPAGGLAGTGILLAGFLGLYLRCHFRARRLEAQGPPPPGVAGPVAAGKHGLLLPHLTTLLALALGLAALAHAWAHYDALPDRVPVHFGLSGEPDAWRPRSFGAVLMMPLLTLVVGAGLGGVSYLVAGAHLASRHPDRGISLAAQLRFRRAVVRFLCGTALLVTSLLAAISFSAVRVGLGIAPGLHPVVPILGGLLLLQTLGGAVYLAVRYGQGGARLERAAARTPLADGLADNRRWFLGTFYVNPEDPSLVVEHRFGLGYTLNLGNWRGVALLAIFVGVVLVILVWALVAMG